MNKKRLAMLAVLGIALVILAGCGRSGRQEPRTARIEVTIEPSTFYVNEPQIAIGTIVELGGVGVDLNLMWVRYYDDAGIFVSEWGWRNDEGRAWYDEMLGTHYLPAYGEIQADIVGEPFDATGTQDLTFGGHDDNDHAVEVLVTIKIIERS